MSEHNEMELAGYARTNNGGDGAGGGNAAWFRELVGMAERSRVTSPEGQPINLPNVAPMEFVSAGSTLSPGQASFLETCSGFDLSPPKKQDGSHADERDVIWRICEDGLVQHLEDNDGDLEVKRYLLFLYGWESMSHKSREECVSTISTIFQPGEAYEHLEKIVEVQSDEEVCLFHNRSEYCEKWKNLVENYGGNDLSTTIFRAPTLLLRMVLRNQLSDNCFLQAPAAAQCYLVQMG
jgi:hypothetical protein